MYHICFIVLLQMLVLEGCQTISLNNVLRVIMLTNFITLTPILYV